MALSASWSVQIAGRLVAGAGGVMLNVQMTKMVTDWFAGREIATAMAIFVNSWPAGVAISLLILPSIGTAWGVSGVYIAVAATIACGIVLLAASYEPPRDFVATTTARARLDRNTIIALIAAALIWGLYNVGFATIFSFGPSMLVEHGWPITTAGSTISIVLWLTVVSVASGGFLADRIGRPGLIIVAGCIVFATLMILLPRSGAVIAITIALGLVCGLPAGSIMSLPARVLQPATRAIGMGLFFTVYYAGMMLGPAIAGACAKWAGSAGAALDFGAAMILACPIILCGFNRIQPAVPRMA
jgi:MFS family permease